MSEDIFEGQSLPDIPEDELSEPNPIPTTPQVFEEPVDLEPEEENLFMALLEVGKRTSQGDVYGHKFLASTLTTEEELIVGLIIKPFINSDGYTRAYKTAIVAAGVREIDGKPIYSPLSGDESLEMVLRKKFEKTSKYYPPVVDKMYDKMVELDKDVFALVKKLGKTFG